MVEIEVELTLSNQTGVLVIVQTVCLSKRCSPCLLTLLILGYVCREATMAALGRAPHRSCHTSYEGSTG